MSGTGLLRVALVAPYYDVDDPATPRETVARQHTLRGLVAGLARSGVHARGFQLHRERARVPVPGGWIDLAPGPVGSVGVARRLHRLFPRHGPAYYVPALGLSRLVRNWRPHVVHVLGIGLHPNLALMRAATLAGRQTEVWGDAGAHPRGRPAGTPALVASFHGGLPPGPGPTRLLSLLGLRNAGAVIFTAAELAEPWVLAGLVQPSQVAIAMETSTLIEPQDRVSARVHMGLEGDPLCLAVARTERVKEPLTTLAGFALVAEKLPGARLHWFGREGALDLPVRAAAAAMPTLANKVVFHGYLDHEQMAGVCSSGDYLLQSSRREWSGLAVIEAMACGAIPIVSDIPSFRQITDSGRAGRLFATGDPSQLCSALLAVEAQGRGAERARVQLHFRRRLSFDALASDLKAIYEMALGHRA